MRRWLTALLLTILLASSLPSVHAQQGDMEYFASFEGLERVIARAWAAPLPASITGTPAGGPPIATAQPESTPGAAPMPGTSAGVEALSVFVYLFDSDEHAAAGFERIDAELQKTVLRDSRAPMNNDLPLTGLGNQARGYMGEMTIADAMVEFTFATVQDGPFVYSLSGMFSGVDSAGLTRDYAQQLIDTKMDRMAEQFTQEGGSRGGLWSKLNGVQPDMPAGSTAFDFLIFPMPEATPSSSQAHKVAHSRAIVSSF